MFAMTSSLGDKFGFENAKITKINKSFNAFHLIKFTSRFIFVYFVSVTKIFV